MSELNLLIDTPIGAVFFVSGAIAAFILLFIFIWKKGDDLHSMAGYIFFFGLSFANYSAAMAFYEGLLPLAAVMITVPLSTISIIVGLASIIPKNKTKLRISTHIISMCVCSVSVMVGTVVNWYHFKISPLSIFRWEDLSFCLVVSLPFILIGSMLAFYFVLKSSFYFDQIQLRNEKADKKANIKKKINPTLEPKIQRKPDTKEATIRAQTTYMQPTSNGPTEARNSSAS